jgi:hypothetical protein
MCSGKAGCPAPFRKQPSEHGDRRKGPADADVAAQPGRHQVCPPLHNVVQDGLFELQDPVDVVVTLTEGHSGYDGRVAVVLYALSAMLMSVPWLAVFVHLWRHPDLVNPEVTPGYLRIQRARPLTGVALYGLAGLVGWFLHPIAGMATIAVMIVYHAATSQGLRDGPLGRLVWRGSR